MIIVCYLFVLSYFDQLQMGTDMNLDDLSCTLDYSAEGSCLFFFFFLVGFQLGLPHLQIHANLHSTMPF